MIYSTIIYHVKRELGLSFREYIFLDAVFHLQVKKGYCFAKNEYYADLLEVGIREVGKVKVQLKEKGFLEVGERGECKTTDKWNDIYLSNHDQKVMPTMTKRSGQHDQKVMDTIYKETDSKSNKEGEAKATPTYSPLGAELIKEMIAIDAKNKLYYGNKTQRAACDFLINEYGFEVVKEMIGIIQANMSKIFNPPTTPVALRDNWVRIIAQDAYKKAEKKAKKPTVMTVDMASV